MKANEDRDDVGVIASAQCQDQEALNKAIQHLVKEVLLPAAAAFAGRKGRQVDLLPESVVQSVVVDELPAAIEKCTSESHLQALLVGAVKNKFRDRMRKGGQRGRPVQFSQPSQDRLPDPADDTRGPGSLVAGHEQGSAASKSFVAFSQRLISLVDDPINVALLSEFVLAGRPWLEAAAGAGLSGPAARQRMSRLRRDLLPAMLDPLRSMLDGEAWAVAEGIFLRRLKAESLARTLGIPESRVQQMLRGSVLPALSQRYGPASLEPMWRLVGRLARGH